MKIGIDVGGTKIHAVLFNKSKPVKEIKVETPKEKQEFFLIIETIITQLSKKNKIEKIGLGIPGKLNNGLVEICPNIMYLEGLNLQKILSKQNKNISINNDATSFAYGVFKLEHPKSQNAYVLTLGTGIGGAIICENKFQNRSIEIGHMLINPKGIRCQCGQVGCFETIASGKALERIYKSISKKTEDGNIIQDLAKKKDQQALESFQIYGQNLALGINNILNSFNPDTIILGGSVANSYKYFQKSLHEELKKNPFSFHKTVKILPSKSAYAATYGAAELN